MGNAKLNYEELLTVLTEIKRVINSRPISYIYNDEITETLTPSHLLIGQNILSEVNNADLTCDEFNLNKEGCTKRLTYLQNLLFHYWKRFEKDYLCYLREHQLKNKRNYNMNQSLKFNDMVLITDNDLLPRNQWPKAVVHELVVGSDNQVRGAILRVKSNGKFNYIKRDAKRLTLSELENENDVDDGAVRARRNAAVNTDAFRQALM